jgi:hypothetical protein
VVVVVLLVPLTLAGGNRLNRVLLAVLALPRTTVQGVLVELPLPALTRAVAVRVVLAVPVSLQQ